MVYFIVLSKISPYENVYKIAYTMWHLDLNESKYEFNYTQFR